MSSDDPRPESTDDLGEQPTDPEPGDGPARTEPGDPAAPPGEARTGDAGADTDESADTGPTVTDTVSAVDDVTDTSGAETDEAAPGAAESDTHANPGGPPRWLVLGSAAFAFAAFVVAAFFGVQWWSSVGGDDVEIAQAREKVAATTHEAVLAFTNLDHENIDGYFAAQKELATPELGEEIAEIDEKFREALVDSEAKVTATVQDVAVEELNLHAGKASVLATVQSTSRMKGQDDLSKNMRLQIQLERMPVDGEQRWLVATLSEAV